MMPLRRMAGAGRKPGWSGRSAEQRDGKGCGQDSSGNTAQASVLRARDKDRCL